MKIRFFFIILTICALKTVGLSQVQKGQSKKNTRISGFVCPKVLDNFAQVPIPARKASISLACVNIDGIAPIDDTIFLSGGSIVKWYSGFYPSRKHINADHLMVLVDTTQIETVKLESPWTRSSSEKNDSTYCSAHPIFVVNNTLITRKIEIQDGQLIAIQEALDSSGTWKPIQIWQWSWCGNSYTSVVLKPKHIAVGKVPCYSGNYFTSLRVRVRLGGNSTFSNTYHDWIDYKQFNLPKELKADNGDLGFNLSFLSDK